MSVVQKLAHKEGLLTRDALEKLLAEAHADYKAVKVGLDYISTSKRKVVHSIVHDFSLNLPSQFLLYTHNIVYYTYIVRGLLFPLILRRCGQRLK